MQSFAGLLRVSALAVAVGAAGLSATQSDPQTSLDEARAAMGGAVVGRVSSLRIQGTWRRTIGQFGMEGSLNIYWQAPDRYVVEEEQTMAMGDVMLRRNGFNGDRRISETIAPHPLPAMPSGAPDDVIVARLRQDALRLLLPLLASSSVFGGAHPVTLASGQSSTGEHVVIVEGPNGQQTQVLFDASTRLPAVVAWMGRPVTTRTTSTLVAVPAGRGGLPPSSPPPPMPSPMLPGDPTAGMPDAEYRMTFTDYRIDNGVNWPRRITTTVDAKPYEEIRVRRYQVNPNINARTFR